MEEEVNLALTEEEEVLEQTPEVDNELVKAVAPDAEQPIPERDAIDQFLEQNLAIPLRDFIDNTLQGDKLSKEDIEANRDEAREDRIRTSRNVKESLTGTGPGELVGAVLGGGVDAVESIGATGEIIGDTLKTNLNRVFGRPVDATQDPGSPEYMKKDGNWLQVPDQYEPENVTNIGKFGRELVEFGLITRWTGALGRQLGMPRVAGAGLPGNRAIQFLRIGADGAIADLITEDSEEGNIANAAQAYVPWLLPDIMNALAVKEEDNVYISRIKTALSGSGFNYIAHALGSFIKATWKAKNYLKGKKVTPEVVDKANELANQAYKTDLEDNLKLDEEAATNKAAENFIEGKGTSHSNPLDEFLIENLDEAQYQKYIDPDTTLKEIDELEELANQNALKNGDEWVPDRAASKNQIESGMLERQPDPFVNPDLFNDSEKALYRPEPNAAKKAVLESNADVKAGGNGRSSQVIATESYIHAIAMGNKNIETLLREVLEDLGDMYFKKPGNLESYNDMIVAALTRAKPMLDRLDVWAGGKRIDLASEYRKMLKNNPGDRRTFTYDTGETASTIGPIQRDVNIIVQRSLAELTTNIAKGALDISSDLPIGRQINMLLDAQQVLFIESKKYGMLWSLDGHTMQAGGAWTKKGLKAAKAEDIKVMTEQAKTYFDSLRAMVKAGRYDELRELVELWRLTDGVVTDQKSINEYLLSRLIGGRMPNMKGEMVPIKGRIRRELQGHFFNSTLSNPSTPIKSVLFTNMLGILRPIETALGSILPHRLLLEKMGSKKTLFKNYDSGGNDFSAKQLAVAAAQVESMRTVWSEAIRMAKVDFGLGWNKKNQMYTGKFDLEEDLVNWKASKKIYENHGNPFLRSAYGFVDMSVNVTTHPLMKYSQIIMGAGDTAARVNIGRQHMVREAATEAIERGVNVKDLKKVALDTAELFRDKIYKKNRNDEWVIKDQAARLAGDEAALTTSLEENFRGFQLISNIPLLKTVFPYVKPGFNALKVAFQHTPLEVFRNKYVDLVVHGRNLDHYGIKPQDLPNEIRLIEGRIALGSMLLGIATIRALQGGLTGSMPKDPDERRLWKLNNIQPSSLVFTEPDGSKKYVSFQKVEIFNTLLTTVANVVNMQDTLGEAATENMFSKLAFMFGAVIVDNSMLSGVQGLSDMLSTNDSGDAVRRFGARTIRAHFPLAGLSGGLGSMVDAVEKEANTFWEYATRRDLFIKSILKPRYDILSKDRSGKKFVYGPSNPFAKAVRAFLPVAVTDVEGDPIKETLLQIRYPYHTETSILEGETLTSGEASELSRILSTSTTLRPSLERLFNSPHFKQQLELYTSKDLKVSEGFDYRVLHEGVSKIFETEKRWAKGIMMLNNSDLSERINIRKAKKAALRSGDEERINELINMPK